MTLQLLRSEFPYTVNEKSIFFLSVFGRYNFILVIKMSPTFVNCISEKVCDNLLTPVPYWEFGSSGPI